jgi:hypothetical protein
MNVTMATYEVARSLEGSVAWFVLFSASVWFAYFTIPQFVGILSSHPEKQHRVANQLLASSADRGYWATSIVSTFFGLSIALRCLNCGLSEDLFQSFDIQKTTHCSANILDCCIGYFVNDLVWCLYFRTKWPGSTAILLHHVVALATCLDFRIQGVGHNLIQGIMLLEVTTPFVNLRYFLSQLGYKDSSLYVWNGFMMTLLWFLFRICYGFYIGLWIWRMHAGIISIPSFSTRWISIWGNYGVAYFLQWLWFVKIVKGASKVLIGDPKKEGVKES